MNHYNETIHKLKQQQQIFMQTLQASKWRTKEEMEGLEKVCNESYHKLSTSYDQF